MGRNDSAAIPTSAVLRTLTSATTRHRMAGNGPRNRTTRITGAIARTPPALASAQLTHVGASGAPDTAAADAAPMAAPNIGAPTPAIPANRPTPRSVSRELKRARRRRIAARRGSTVLAAANPSVIPRGTLPARLARVAATATPTTTSGHRRGWVTRKAPSAMPAAGQTPATCCGSMTYRRLSRAAMPYETATRARRKTDLGSISARVANHPRLARRDRPVRRAGRPSVEGMVAST
jgi:hypothetical protein